MPGELARLRQAEIAFLYDPFVRLAATLDSIFELSVPFWQLRHHLIGAARGVAIEGGGLQDHASSELEFVHGLGRRGRWRDQGLHAASFRPT